MDIVSGSNNLNNRIQHEMHIAAGSHLDYFAAMAMQAIESNPAKDYEPQDLVKRAYVIARLMLAESARTAQPEPAAEQGEWIRLRPGECFDVMAKNYYLLYENGILVAYRVVAS